MSPRTVLPFCNLSRRPFAFVAVSGLPVEVYISDNRVCHYAQHFFLYFGACVTVSMCTVQHTPECFYLDISIYDPYMMKSVLDTLRSRHCQISYQERINLQYGTTFILSESGVLDMTWCCILNATHITFLEQDITWYYGNGSTHIC